MNYALWFRIALGYLALISVQIGVWALAAPKSFYDSYPGLGRAWVAVDGPYNEHLVRDVGALNLALAAVLVFAGVTLSRPVIVAASIATLVWGVPHLVYHAFNTGELGGSDVAASLGGLLGFAAVPVLLLVFSSRLGTNASNERDVTLRS